MAIDYSPSWANEELNAWRDSVIRFVEDEVAPADAQAREQGHLDPAFWRRAGALGMLCTDIPEAFGGAGGDFRHEAVIHEELGRRGLLSLNTGVHSIALRRLLIGTAEPLEPLTPATRATHHDLPPQPH